MASGIGTMVRQVAEDILQHDHSGVDNDAEIDGTDRKQVGGFAPYHRYDHGEKQRDRNRRRYDDGAAQVAQEHPLDQEDQRNAEEHVVQHGIDRHRYEVATIVEWLD